jgi:predicted transcriptional regulator
MIEKIRQAFKNGRYEYSLHAVDQSILRHILRREIEEAIEEGEK